MDDFLQVHHEVLHHQHLIKHQQILIRNNYHVCLSNVNDYVEGQPAKEYFTLDEIRELEPKILESLKIINEAKGNNK